MNSEYVRMMCYLKQNHILNIKMKRSYHYDENEIKAILDYSEQLELKGYSVEVYKWYPTINTAWVEPRKYGIKIISKNNKNIIRYSYNILNI